MRWKKPTLEQWMQVGFVALFILAKAHFVR